MVDVRPSMRRLTSTQTANGDDVGCGSGTALCLKMKEAMQIVHDLRNLGLDSDVDLPKICVVGKQSSGKSSVMEALTGVAVPRCSGTCTRCAFEISTWGTDATVDNGRMSCSVGIRFQPKDGGSKKRVMLATTSGQAEIADQLKWAQRVLLNMRLFQQQLDQGTTITLELAKALLKDKSDESQFTQDVVVVELRGSGLSDLELIDLPGLIQSVENVDDEHLIPLIKDLSSSYLEQANTIVSMCCPFNDDMENQAVRTLARQHDAKGLRTVGVLTKADLLPQGQEKEWQAVLRNDSHTMQHGYFAVRNPPQSELNASISREDARVKEEHFFSDSSVGLLLKDAAPERCGTVALRDFLGELLCDLIRNQMVPLRETLREQLLAAENELRDLGQSVEPRHAFQKLTNIIAKLARKFEADVEADVSFAGNADFWHELKCHYMGLRQACYETRPRFLPGDVPLDDSDLVNETQEVLIELRSWEDWFKLTDALDTSQRATRSVTINGVTLDTGMAAWRDSWLEDHHHATPDSQSVRTFETWLQRVKGEAHSLMDVPEGWGRAGWRTCSSKWKENAEETYRWRPRQLVQICVAWPVKLHFVSPVAAEQSTDFHEITISSVQALIEKMRGRELSLLGSPAGYHAAREMVRVAQARWANPTDTCVEKAKQSLQAMVQRHLADELHAYPTLEARCTTSLMNLIQTLVSSTVTWKASLFDGHERAHDMFTQNDHYLQEGFAKAKDTIERVLHAPNLEKLNEEQKQTLDQLLKIAGYGSEQLMVKHKHTSDEAMNSMAIAYAYFKVSFKRYCDNLPRTIDDRLLRAFKEQSREVLMAEFGLDSPADADLSAMFAEDPAMIRKRRDLEAKVSRQRQGLELLDGALKAAKNQLDYGSRIA